MISFTNLFSSAFLSFSFCFSSILFFFISSALILISSLYLACASLSFFISASISSGVCFLGLTTGAGSGFGFFFSCCTAGLFGFSLLLSPLLLVAHPSKVNCPFFLLTIAPIFLRLSSKTGSGPANISEKFNVSKLYNLIPLGFNLKTAPSSSTTF